MNASPALHPHSNQELLKFADQPSHAILLIGPNGIGKTYIAKYLSSLLLEIKFEDIDSFAQLVVIEPEKSSISIDKIRELQKFLQLKTTGSKTIRRIAIIDHGQYLSREAQNAFLKILEEPPADTVIIMTCNNANSLLPTILSRLQIITLHTPVQDDLLLTFKNRDYAQQILTKNYYLSGGLPGLMYALMTEDTDHPLVDGVAVAKDILNAPVNERLIIMNKLSSKRDEASYVVEALLRISSTGILQACSNNDSKRLMQWHHVLKESHAANNALSINANLKLVLTNLALQL